MEAIRQTKVDMKVWLGNYVLPDDSAPYERQKQAIKAALEEYGTDHVGGITVGNEFMLKYVLHIFTWRLVYLFLRCLSYITGNGGDSPDVNGALGNAGKLFLRTSVEKFFVT